MRWVIAGGGPTGMMLAGGLVARHAYAEAPPRVEYELTKLGRTLIDPITMLAHWAEANDDAILDAQDRT